MCATSYAFHSNLFHWAGRRKALAIANNVDVKLIQERARVAELFASAVNSGMRTFKVHGMEKC